MDARGLHPSKQHHWGAYEDKDAYKRMEKLASSSSLVRRAGKERQKGEKGRHKGWKRAHKAMAKAAAIAKAAGLYAWHECWVVASQAARAALARKLEMEAAIKRRIRANKRAAAKDYELAMATPFFQNMAAQQKG